MTLRALPLLLGSLLALTACEGGLLDLGGGGGGNRTRNVDVTLDLGPEATLRNRVITLSGTIRPDRFDRDAPGTTEGYAVALEFATGTDQTFLPATLLLAPGLSLQDPINFPVGTSTPFTIKWDRDADITQDVVSRVYLRLTAQQAQGTGIGTVTRGPKEVDVRGTGGCSARTPRITRSSVLLQRNVPSNERIPVEFGVAPLTFTVNEPLSNGLELQPDGRITGTPLGPMAPILRLVTVTDSCGGRLDQAWMTIAVP